MNKPFFKLLLAFFAISSSFELSAQFSYVEFDLGYNFTTYEKTTSFAENEPTRNSQLKGTFTYIYRSTRFVGFGLSIGVPFIQSFKWNFNNAPLSNGNNIETYDNKFSGDSDFIPLTFNYDIEHKTSITLVSRFFFSPGSPVFVDLRYSFHSIREEFTFRRPNGQYPVEKNFLKTHSARGPGFSIGYIPNIGNQFYFKYQYNMDFYRFDSTPSFSYNIEHSERFSTSNDIITANLTSQIGDREISYNLILGIGYYF